jgi:hypothetical protein
MENFVKDTVSIINSNGNKIINNGVIAIALDSLLSQDKLIYSVKIRREVYENEKCKIIFFEVMNDEFINKS